MGYNDLESIDEPVVISSGHLSTPRGLGDAGGREIYPISISR